MRSSLWLVWEQDCAGGRGRVDKWLGSVKHHSEVKVSNVSDLPEEADVVAELKVWSQENHVPTLMLP